VGRRAIVLNQSVAASAAVMPEPIQPHILIVDDDSSIRSLLKDYLTEKGLRASTAETGAGYSFNAAVETIY
jgi:CheY-like chemotaxis protein